MTTQYVFDLIKLKFKYQCFLVSVTTSANKKGSFSIKLLNNIKIYP